ncbi:uncharacterized protein LOC104446486 [Eucalyptus grandis]|uniref:uncharacterized protein LOC104446486 n=1 Tax=Eucalyptus grandis TaxID=71139 RepID=UPI00192ECAEE|nr:uncharacterized protein LOC104446486 [Eucalyptus grandis]
MEMAELLKVCWLDVHGRFDVSNFSLGTTCEVAFVILMRSSGDGWQIPVNIRLTLPDGTKQEHKENLMEKPRGDWIEIIVGELSTTKHKEGEMEVSMFEHGGHWKSGLVVKGVLIRPKNRTVKHWVEKESNKDSFMIYARGLSITWAENNSYWQWLTQKDAPSDDASVEMAELLKVCWLDVHGRFDLSKLSMGTTYEVAFVILMRSSADGWQIPVNIRLTLPDGTKQEHTENLMEKPRRDWIEIKVGELSTTKHKEGEMEVSMFEHGEHWKSGLVVKGVLIRPKNRTMKHWVENESKKNCFMIYAQGVSITWAENNSYWQWLTEKDAPSDDAPVEMAELLNVCWLDVHGRFDVSKLSLGTTYEVAFVILMRSSGDGWQIPVNIQLTLPDGTKQEHTENLMEKPRRDWIEIKAGELSTTKHKEGEMEVSMFEHGGHWKSGLVVKGVLIRPKNRTVKHWVENESKKNCFMIYARGVSITWAENNSYWQWLTEKDAPSDDAPVEMAELLNVCWLDVHGMFDVSKLSPGTTYEVALVILMRSSGDGWQIPVNIRLTLPDGTKQEHTENLMEKPRGDWIEIKVGELSTTKHKEGKMEVSMFEHGGHWKSGLVVKGVLIRPKNRTVKHWVEKESKKNCFMIYARGVSITWAENNSYWQWLTEKDAPSDDAPVEMAELLNVCWLDVHGRFDVSKLSPGTTYEVAFVILMRSSGDGWQIPVNMQLTLPDGTKQEHKENLMEKPRGDWIEIKAGELSTSKHKEGEMEVSMFEHGGLWKRGLVIKGVLIRPKN